MAVRGKKIRGTYTEAAVSTSSSEILASDGSREMLLLQNTGTADVYIAFGEDATADANSFLLKASGIGIFYQDQVVETSSVHAITASGSSTIKIGVA